jgi:2-methylaconitate cis-trans-isomerase PrpF
VTHPEHTLRIPALLARGGTSRGLIFRRQDLPRDESLWDAIFLAAIGSPDPRQLDGVGAGDSHTSKVAVVNPSRREDADVDFLFAEVAITEARVDYAGNSGNIIAALGPFAVDEGWVQPRSPMTEVRVFNLNTSKSILLDVPVKDGRSADDGDFVMPGVNSPGPRVDMHFPFPGGALTGSLLTADGPRSRLTLSDGTQIDATLVDAANPVVFVDARVLGVAQHTSPAQLNADTELLARLQRIRSAASVRFGLVSRPEDAWQHSPMVPFLVLLHPPCDFPNIARPGHTTCAADMDLSVRVLSLNMIHKSVNVTVSVATTAAALLPGSLAHAMSDGRARAGDLRIGHPSGVTRTGNRHTGNGKDTIVESVSIGRTARYIMRGEILVQPHLLRWLRAQRDGR